MVHGVGIMTMVALQGGPFLPAFVLALGGGSGEVGLLATIALVTQAMQIPGLLLLQHLPRRRLLVVISTLLYRLGWLCIAAIPLIRPHGRPHPLPPPAPGHGTRGRPERTGVELAHGGNRSRESEGRRLLDPPHARHRVGPRLHPPRRLGRGSLEARPSRSGPHGLLGPLRPRHSLRPAGNLCRDPPARDAHGAQRIGFTRRATPSPPSPTTTSDASSSSWPSGPSPSTSRGPSSSST